jgi:DNA repair protein RecN (Recombination protein N)
MLTALHIEDFVLIDRLSLALGPGLTALTGETGAGKSILLEALGLAAGARTARSAVRRGAERGVVAAAFAPAVDHPVWRALEQNGVSAGEDEIILRRVQEKDGRTRAFLNDQPVSVGLLRGVSELLVEIHGQHDSVSFLSAPAHRALLDAFAARPNALAETARLFAGWRAADEALAAARRARAEAEREEDYLRHVVAELAELDPQAEEEAALAARRAEMIAAQRAGEDLASAAAALAEDGLEGRLSAAARRLARAAAQFAGDNALLAAASDRIERAVSEAREAQSAVDEAVERLGFDAQALDETERRLFAIRAAARKHGVAPDGLPGFYAKAAAALAALDAGAEAIAGLEQTAAAAKSAYFDAARALSDIRRKAAARLDAAVKREFEPLKLAHAIFATRVETHDANAGPSGVDAVEFLVATNPGAPLGPLKTIASGGELSRFVLALKAALAAKENRTVIIFDEVDAGVGGAVADAVGERLARLAEDAQVLVVTHSPQVAARAAHHWRVEKAHAKGATTTRVVALDAAGRVEEIARMLSGAIVTDEARAAARRLLGAPAAAAKRRRA